MQFDPTLKCELRPRSGLSLKGIQVSLGTIDPDYRGEVKAIAHNTTSETVCLPIGFRIAQLVFSPVSYPFPVEVPCLTSTPRSHHGF